MKSKFISSILIIIILISLFQPIILAADNTIKTYQDFEYTINDNNEITIKKYKGEATNVTIPGTIEENQVCYIGFEAFRGNTNIQSIEIPDTVIKIDTAAFLECRNLNNVNLSKSLKEIGGYAFGDCDSLNSIEIPKSIEKTNTAYYADYIYGYCYGVFIASDNLKNITFEEGITTIPTGIFANNKSIETITIPDTVETIGNCAFNSCTNLKTINLSNNLKQIGAEAFYGVKELQEIIMPDTVTKIDTAAFLGCSKLSNVKLSKSLKELGGYAFGDCDSLISIEIPKSIEKTNTAYYADYIYGYCYGVFIASDNLKNITFEEGITSIPTGIFANNKSLEEITIPDTVETIGSAAFNSCTNLKTINLSNSLKQIGAEAFYGVKELQEIIMPDTVTKIEKAAFLGCSKLNNVKLSKSLKELGGYAFGDCDSLTSIEIPKSIEKTYTAYYPDYIWAYCYGVFIASDNLKKVTFEEGITRIPAGLFANNKSIETITIPDTVTTIENEAFIACDNLKNVYIPKNLSNIANNAFYNCSEELTLICEKYSSATKTFIDKDWNCEFYDDVYKDNENKAINKNESEYHLNTNTMSNGYISAKLKYSIKENAFKEINDKKIIVKIPKEMELHTSGIYVDSKLISNYQVRDEKIQIPIEKRTGTITFCLNVLSNTKIRTYAELSYSKNNESYSDVFEVLIEENSALSIVAPEESNSDTVSVQGVGPKGQDITISSEGQDDIVVKTSNTTGRYTADVKINTSYNYYESKITAKTTNSDGQEILAYTKVRYNEGTPSLKSFIMKYSDHSDKQIDLVQYQNNRTPLNYYPNVAPAFELTFENAEKIDKVYVVSTRDGAKKTLEAKYNPEKNIYEAKGFFDPNNTSSYVPGTITYEYTLKRNEPESEENFNIENNVLYQAAKEAKENDYLQVNQIEKDIVDTKGTQILDNAHISYGDVTTKVYRMSYGENGLAKLNDSPVYEGVEFYVTEIADISDADKDLLLSQFDALSAASTFTKYFTKDGKLSFNVDLSDPYSVTSFAYDVSSNKLITYTIGVAEDGGLNALGEFFDCLNTISPVFEVAKNYYELDYNNDELTKKILESNMSEHGKQTALQCAERLDTFRRAYFVYSTGLMILEQTDPTGFAAFVRVSSDIIFETMFEIAENVMLDENSPLIEGIAYVIRGVIYPVRWIIDPSGYVYDSKTGERLENVKCTIYYKKNDDSEAILWNATEYEQLNPLYTDEDGKYAWDVPEGLWQVKYEKEGYTTTYSEWLVVPPPQTDVNISMNKIEQNSTSNNNQENTNTNTNSNTNTNTNTNITGKANANTVKKNISKLSISGIKNKTYTGKALKQSLAVKDGTKTLKNGTDYTVSYKNNKKVGTATVVITGKGDFAGTVTKTFMINPKGVSLKKLTSGKKQFKATWNRNTTQTTGYQIQYSTNKKFNSGNKTIKVKKNKTTSTKAKKLKAKKKYYVRIRTYKTVNGKAYYSDWSKVKNVTTKK